MKKKQLKLGTLYLCVLSEKHILITEKKKNRNKQDDDFVTGIYFDNGSFHTTSIHDNQLQEIPKVV
jgi:hypothetical protein